MEENLKQLLLADLCARLPYGVIGVTNEGNQTPLLVKGEADWDILTSLNYRLEKFGWRPYLRSMSSMTEEERDEVKEICDDYLDEWENAETVVDKWKLDAKTSYKRSAFYNSHYLDWNSLIPMGLAIEAPEGMYNTKIE